MYAILFHIAAFKKPKISKTVESLEQHVLGTIVRHFILYRCIEEIEKLKQQ